MLIHFPKIKEEECSKISLSTKQFRVGEDNEGGASIHLIK